MRVLFSALDVPMNAEQILKLRSQRIEVDKNGSKVFVFPFSSHSRCEIKRAGGRKGGGERVDSISKGF